MIAQRGSASGGHFITEADAATCVTALALKRTRQPVSRRLRDKPRAPACVPVGFVVRPQS